MILYRPVGEKEYILIKNSGFRKFPPRLIGQPILYPVLNQRYANEVAKNWNSKDTYLGYVGYVLKFEVNDECINKYPIQTVDDTYHQKLWILAEELEIFNNNIKGLIEVIDKFDGIKSN